MLERNEIQQIHVQVKVKLSLLKIKGQCMHGIRTLYRALYDAF